MRAHVVRCSRHAADVSMSLAYENVLLVDKKREQLQKKRPVCANTEGSEDAAHAEGRKKVGTNFGGGF